MRITITDDYQNVIESLDCYRLLDGHEVTIVHDYITDGKKLISAMNDPEAIVLNRTRTRITESILSHLPNLKVVSQTGKNAGHIDVSACEKHGVTILEGRGNPIATAELAWALIMNGLRMLPMAIDGMKRGKWQTNMGRRVHGKRIGIWSYGRIGKMVAQYARAFHAEVLVWGGEESCAAANKDGFEIASSKREFLESCDVISLHIRLKPNTHELISKEDLIMMKPTALLVNTSRAGLIVHGALEQALIAGRPGYAAIDVFDEEPIFDPKHPLLTMSNVICTPHLGYVEKDSYELYFGIAFQNLIDFISHPTL